MDEAAKKRTRRWLLYILSCSDGTLYTGITNNLEQRLERHNDGTASRYTRARLPVTLVYTEGCRSRSYALKKELRIKALTRQEKEAYIEHRARQKSKRLNRKGARTARTAEHITSAR
jgi:predicted GIY-YIG superfamily endonuclease